jgi:hypothetical protein
MTAMVFCGMMWTEDSMWLARINGMMSSGALRKITRMCWNAE